MKTFTVTYGHLNIATDLNLGVRKRDIKGTTYYYGHVHFPNSDTHKRTLLSDDQELIKQFVNDVASHCKRADFPFDNEHGEKQWFDFQPHAPSLALAKQPRA